MNRPLTKKEWLEFLEKACDEFDWSASHQQRKWVELTDDEIIDIRRKTFDAVATNYEVYRAIEAKLKEKNNG